MHWRIPATLGLLTGLMAPAALAGDFDLPPDVGLGPMDVADTATDPEAEVPPARSDTLVLEGRFTRAEPRRGDAQQSFRLSAQWMGSAALGRDLALRFNLRGRATRTAGEGFVFDEDVRFDVQELALNWQARPGLSFDLGRVNLRNGVAQGFNPTDWFKADSLVTSDSADPGDRRLERLGTLMIAGQASLGADLLSFGYRPRITASGDDVLAGHDVYGLNLDRTNPSEAVFLKYAPATGDNINLTASLLVEDGNPGAGLEVSGAIGQHLVLYAEMFSQKRLSLAAAGMPGGSAGLRDDLGADEGRGWRHQAALGGTWALPETIVGARDISVSLEYHYNGAGLSARQLQALAGAAGADLGQAGALRGFAATRQEPLAREQIFTRVAWNDLWNDADLSLIGFYVPADHSGLVQISAAFPLNDNAEISLRASRSFGDDTSAYGANPTRTTAQVVYRYTF